jgi:hypothetical protein
MSSKLTINLSNGQLEVEGSEDFVKEMYLDFKKLLSQNPIKEHEAQSQIREPEITSSEKKTGKSKSQKTKKPQTTKVKHGSDLKFLTDLNLRPKGKDSLKDYSSRDQVKTAADLTLLIVYYMKEVLGLDKVTVNHIYTAYKEIGKKIPTPLKQVLTNHKNSKNWIDVSDWEDIKFTIPGMNHVEHDLLKS